MKEKTKMLYGTKIYDAVVGALNDLIEKGYKGDDIDEVIIEISKEIKMVRESIKDDNSNELSFIGKKGYCQCCGEKVTEDKERCEECIKGV